MSGCLLDTNVVSEIVRVSPDPQVRSFLLEQSELWLSMIALHELEFGLNLLPQERRREALRTALPTCLETYADRILPVARAEAEQAALLRVQARRAGRVLHPADALISGTAIVHNLILAARNVNDFAVLAGQSHLNPEAKISHEGHPQGVPLPIFNRLRLKNRSPKGLFSAVFSELGSNQVVSRVLAQLDAIALAVLDDNVVNPWETP